MTTAKNNNKGLIFTFIAVFLLPVILAKIALEQHWFNEAATNKGELLAPPYDLSQISTSEQTAKWKLVYVLPQHCDSACKNALISLTHIRSALGKEQERVESVVVAIHNSDADVLKSLEANPLFRLINSDQQSVNQVFKDGKTHGIFIADTLNNVILRYPTQSDSQQAVLRSKDILSDMQKVLKLSRIG